MASVVGVVVVVVAVVLTSVVVIVVAVVVLVCSSRSDLTYSFQVVYIQHFLFCSVYHEEKQKQKCASSALFAKT